LLTAEYLRKQKKLPLILPDYYLLDITEQWYPPGFSVFLSLIPPPLLGRYHWLISPILDLFNLLLLLLLVGLTTHSVSALLLAGLTYTFTLTLLLEGINLNSRFLGNVQVSLALLSLDLFLKYQNYWLLGLCLLSVILILFTHKMAFQFLWILALLGSLAAASLWPIAFLLAAMALAFVLSRGYYLKILRGHYDIVSFWNKYWYALGAHQVYASPLYQQAQKTGWPKNMHLARLSFWSGMKFLLVHQPFIIPLLMLFSRQRTEIVSAGSGLYALWFIAGMVVFLLTTYINKLKLFGEGYKYLKFTAFPGAFLLATMIYRWDSLWTKSLGAAWLVVIIAVVIAWAIKLKQGWFKQDQSLLNAAGQDLIAYLKDKPELDSILCLPTNICDAVVYHARKHVLWGTHHYLFNERVGDFYPLLKYPLDFYVHKYKIKNVVINKSYVDPKDLGLNDPLAEFGTWAVYQMGGK
jgi:hypothetical protein